MNTNLSSDSDPRSSAFTLVELVVVIGMVTLGALMLVPALARTRTNSPALQCMNNARQIARGWIMYAEDNGGALAPNSDGTSAGKTSTSPAWVAGWLDFTASNADNTNSTLLVNHDMWPYGAYLGAYVGKSATVFKCPGDHSTVLAGGVATPRARSISMNSYVGNSRTWTFPSKYAVCLKMPQVLRPADRFVTLDEHEDGINDGRFFTDPDTLYQLIDYPASHHGNAGGLSFADGHSEIHKWLDPRTRPPVSGYSLPLNVNLPGDTDVLWIAQHSAGVAVYP
jgi:type II secretory pathway pseudopilin PulG